MLKEHQKNIEAEAQREAEAMLIRAKIQITGILTACNELITAIKRIKNAME